MNRACRLTLLLLVCFIPACMPQQYTLLESRVMDVLNPQSIHVQVDHGEVVIVGTQEQQVQVGGQVLHPDELEYQVSATEDQISIKVNAQRFRLSNAHLRVEVRVPQGTQVKVETNSASVFVSNYRGDLEVASTAGNLTVEHTIGRITLRSNRGNITVLESIGTISVVGNYGLLNLKNVHGETGVSTIMGNIVFGGLIQQGDTIRLETDHGSVSVNLNQNSALGIQVRSTSGDVICMVAGLTTTTRTCDGDFQSAGGALSIRTVSGAVTVKLTP
ncbi:MAG: DUF4097 family beta strand repeat-containing protein [Anaerolineales bacterium]|nr:MAG: DUF4097 family beta strand repeat-containing protein [Anaerolineales bacterium]